MTTEALKLALEALNEWGKGFPDLVGDLDKQAINAIKEALSSVATVAQPPVAKPHDQEPVAWLTEERYAEMHTSKWTPKIQQVFSKDGILESQTIQYAPQSKPVSYPPAQRKPLTDEEIDRLWEMWLTQKYGSVTKAEGHVFARAIEAAHGITAATQLKE